MRALRFQDDDIDSTFVVEDGDRSWSIPLPFCLQCDLSLENVSVIAVQGAA
jgi:hypothetical protein